MDIFVQALGLAGMAFNILSFQAKNSRQIMLMQMIGSLLFVLNYYFLGGYMGALMNFVCVFRAIYFVKVKNPPKYILGIFLAVFIGFYILTFTVFGKEPTTANLLLEILPIIGMTSTTYGYYSHSDRTIRRVGFINNPCWLTYNIFAKTIGGILCDSICIISVIIGLIRFKDKKAE